MTITRAITVSCCGEIELFKHEYEALEFARKHLKQNHPRQFAGFERRGRLAARSQNGCGYMDTDGQPKTASGWASALQSFRNAWIEKVIERELLSKLRANCKEWPKCDCILQGNSKRDCAERRAML